MYKKNKREFFKLNNKGFAITSIIYSMLLLFIILMTLIILTLGRKKVLLDKSKNETLEFLGGISDNTNLGVSGESLDNRTYVTGEAITLGGYNWHIVGDDGTNVTLLMDANQLGDNSAMEFGSSQWKGSSIRSYLNNTLYPELSKKIEKIVPVEICSYASSSAASNGKYYSGWLMDELNLIGASCNSESYIVTDNIRLLTYNEYRNIIENVPSNQVKIPSITMISADSAKQWLYCASNSCGTRFINFDNTDYGYNWWLMSNYASYYGASTGYINLGYSIYSNTSANHVLGMPYGRNILAVRPVITVQKSLFK